MHSWPNYIVWNEDHKNWLKSHVVGNRNYLKGNYIPFAGEYKELEKKKTIVIFDVPPKKPQIYYQLNNPYNIYTLQYCQKFISDILNSIDENLLQQR